MNEYLDFAKALAEEAGKIMLHYFRSEDFGLRTKNDKSPVTLADTEVNSMVIARVKERFPEHGVLGEEESFNLNSSSLWVVDPLDGTSTFSRGMSGWVFSMALVVNHESKVAVIYDPILERLFWAQEGVGAFEDGNKLNVSQKPSDGFLNIMSWAPGGIKGVLFKEGVDGKLFMAYGEKFKNFPETAPVAHAIALTGAGRIDATVTSCVNPWDLAAGAFIAQQAGAIVTDMYGHPIDKWDQDIKGLIAAAPAIHKELVEIIKPISEAAETQ